jgi:uncharacterized membrane protein YhhN
MTAVARWLPAATLACAAVAIAAATGLLAPSSLLFIFKPLTTLMIVVHAWRRDGSAPVARRWVLIGLLLSLCGDVALLWPERGFLQGLIFFLLAHLAYLVAFTRTAGLAARIAPFIVYALVAGAILSQLWPGVPAALRVPVVAYVGCLAAMAAQAAVALRLARGGPDVPRARLLALGGALFVLSDALLATHRFHGALPWPGLWILASYWAAQWCIASWLRPSRFAWCRSSPAF